MRTNLFPNTQVNTCKSGNNTWAYVGDINDKPQLSCVYQSDDAQNEFLSNPKVRSLRGRGFGRDLAGALLRPEARIFSTHFSFTLNSNAGWLGRGLHVRLARGAEQAAFVHTRLWVGDSPPPPPNKDRMHCKKANRSPRKKKEERRSIERLRLDALCRLRICV